MSLGAISKEILYGGFTEKGQFVCAIQGDNLVGTDNAYFAHLLAVVARGYVDMMLQRAVFASDGRKPREVDREYMEAALARDFAQCMAEGRNGELIS